MVGLFSAVAECGAAERLVRAETRHAALVNYLHGHIFEYVYLQSGGKELSIVLWLPLARVFCAFFFFHVCRQM